MDFIKKYIDIVNNLSNLKEVKHNQSLFHNALTISNSQAKEDFKDFLENNIKNEHKQKDRLKDLFINLSLEDKKTFINFVWSCNISYLIALELKNKASISFKETLIEMDKNNREKYLKESVLRNYLEKYLEIVKGNNFYNEVASVVSNFLNEKQQDEEVKVIRQTFYEFKERIYYEDNKKNRITYKFFNEYLKRYSCVLFGENEKYYNLNKQYDCLLEALNKPGESDFNDVKYIIKATFSDLFNSDFYETFTKQKILMNFYNLLNESNKIGDHEKIFLYNSIVKSYMEKNSYHFIRLVKSYSPNILINKGSILEYPENIYEIKNSLCIHIKYSELFKKISNNINNYDHKTNRLDIDADIIDIEELKMILLAITEVFEKSGVKINFTGNMLKENLSDKNSYIYFSFEGLNGNELKKIAELYLDSFDYVARQVFDIFGDYYKALKSKDSNTLVELLEVYYEDKIDHVIESIIMRKDTSLKKDRKNIKKW